MKIKTVYKWLFCIVIAIIIVNVLLYVSWNNRVTYIEETSFQNGVFSLKYETVQLKRQEVKPYFEKLARKTGQDALINIKELPSEKFNPIRELKNRLLFSYITATRCHDVLYTHNADWYSIDCLGLTGYYEMNSNLGLFYYDYLEYSPSYKSIHKHFKNNDFSVNENGLDIKSLNRPIWTGLLRYPVIVDKHKNVLINLHYLHDIKDIFPGSYNTGLGCDIIENNGKKLIIDDEKAILTYEKRLSEKSISISRNRIIQKYKMYKFGDLKYVDVDAISGLYGYKVNKTFVAGYNLNDPYEDAAAVLKTFKKIFNIAGEYNFYKGSQIGCFVEIDDVSEVK